MKTAIIERMAKHFKARNDVVSLDTLKFVLARPIYRAECDEEQTLAGFTTKRNVFIQKCRDYGTVILYGAGGEGGIYYSELKKNGVEIAVFMDTFKTGIFCGKPIITMEEYSGRYANTAIVITPRLDKQEIKRALESKDIRSILYFDFDSAFTGMNIVLPDAEKLFLASGKEQYFSLPEMPWEDGEVFVDCGAFTGESTLDFIKHCESQSKSYYKIFAFEPDPINARRVAGTLSQLRGTVLLMLA